MNNSSNEFITINGRDFETLLQSSVPYKPPEEIVEVVTPWKKAIKRTLIGLGLSTITLNFYYLNYILPLIGAMLIILGVRALRNESKQFRLFYIATAVRSVYIMTVFSLNTTIDFQMPDYLIAVKLTFAFFYIVLFCRALYSVEKKSGIEPRKTPMVALVIWHAALTFLGVTEYSGFIIPWAMIIVFVFIIVNLNKISKEIDKIGYSIENSPVKIPDGILTALLAVILVAGLGCGYAFGGSYTMQWELKDKNEHAEVQEVKDNLIELGFPERVLDDMTAEDILACKGATLVVVDERQVPFNKGREEKVITEYSETTHIHISTHYDVKEMTVTGVGVRLSEADDEEGDWQLIHHFCWDVNPGFYGTESIQLWPAYRDNYDWWSKNEVTGRVLYTKDGDDYVAPFYSLGGETYTSNSVIFGTETNTDVFAAFSLPNNGERQRGYLTYGITGNVSYIIDSWVNYTHQKTFLQYPAITAKQHRQSGAWNKNFTFFTQQDALQISHDELI